MKTEQVDYLTDKNVMYLTNSLEFKKTDIIENKDFYLLKITYYDEQNKRKKQIDLNHPHKGIKPHVHHGYNHNENDNSKGATGLLPKEKKMVEKVERIWYNHINKKQ